jgi:hypothetical protein
MRPALNYLAVSPLSLCAFVDIMFSEEEECCDDAVGGEAGIFRERERERERVRERVRERKREREREREREKAVHSKDGWCGVLPFWQWI